MSISPPASGQSSAQELRVAPGYSCVASQLRFTDWPSRCLYRPPLGGRAKLGDELPRGGSLTGSLPEGLPPVSPAPSPPCAGLCHCPPPLGRGAGLLRGDPPPSPACCPLRLDPLPPAVRLTETPLVPSAQWTQPVPVPACPSPRVSSPAHCACLLQTPL